MSFEAMIKDTISELRKQVGNGYSGVVIVKNPKLNSPLVSFSGNAREVCQIYSSAIVSMYQSYAPEDVSFDDFTKLITELARQEYGTNGSG